MHLVHLEISKKKFPEDLKQSPTVYKWKNLSVFYVFLISLKFVYAC